MCFICSASRPHAVAPIETHIDREVVVFDVLGATVLECAEQKIDNRAAAAEEASQVPPHDLRASIRRDGRVCPDKA